MPSKKEVEMNEALIEDALTAADALIVRLLKDTLEKNGRPFLILVTNKTKELDIQLFDGTSASREQAVFCDAIVVDYEARQPGYIQDFEQASQAGSRVGTPAI